MGPFPHDAPPATISPQNPAGTDGFEFVEFAHPRAAEARRPCSNAWAMRRSPGTAPRTSPSGARATSTISLNAEPGSHRDALRRRAWAVRLLDGVARGRRQARLRTRRRARAPRPMQGADKALDVPAIVGIGGSLLYFVDPYGAKGSAYDDEFEWLGASDPQPRGRRLLLSRPPHPQCLSRQHGQMVGFLPRAVRLQADPLLRHRRQDHRPASAAPSPRPAARSAFRSTNRPTTTARSRNICTNTKAKASSTSPSAPTTSMTPPTGWPPTG